MHPSNPGEPITRREFLERASRTVVGAGAVASGWGTLPSLVGAAEEATSPDPSIVYRRLGRTKLKISHLVAAWDWYEGLYPEAVRCGINYWHKIAGWPRLPDCLQKLDREAWYCDVVIDVFEEQGAIDQFEWARKSLGLDYIDSFKLHSIYQAPEDVKTKTGVLKAFDTLKKQGKVKFLASAQHGGRTAEICAAMIESGHFDHLQPALSVLPTAEQLAMLELAKKHDVGIIAKKVMGAVNRAKSEAPVREQVEKHLGPDGKWGAAVIKTVLALPGVTAVTALTKSWQQWEDNLSPGGIQPTAQETAAVEEMRRAVAGSLCTYCGECLAHCPQALPISNLLRFAAYHSLYDQPRAAAALYRQLPAARRADRCDHCGDCERACPYGLPIARQLPEVHRRLA
jgi:predicted aldo/keto reductase-like oxidoreductase